MPTAPTQITANKQLFGVSDQAAAPTLVKVTMYQRGTSTAINTGAAFLNIQSADMSQFSGSELTADGLGNPRQLTIFAEGISCRLSVVPEGSTLGLIGDTDSVLHAAADRKSTRLNS